ncbi:aldose 1-epimerase family protein [Chakrabartyella piscis]|uniref:aldose 1-epimerase family protein n=1 Tax=Chakrabartyella piscis TaxID=2918914 RepID=UPI00295856A4|nr:aldose 1-epimerase family protein [Chakrabartyella piscis]
MIYEIKNECLQVQIADKGAELWSIQDASGAEYLWQGDVSYWKDRSPMLFPYVGRLTQGKYMYNKQVYEMTIHGFASSSVFSVAKQEADSITFFLGDSETTKEAYPFAFGLSVTYSLADNKLLVNYDVENKNDTTMYFGIGGHPGFCVPMEDGLDYSDYCMEFGEVTEAFRVGMSDDCYVNGQDVPFALEDGVRLPFAHNMFDDDAIILRDMARSVTLFAPKGKKALHMEYKDMPYLGIWHMPKTDAPYVCIEPWSSIPSRKDMIAELETQADLVSLESDAVYHSGWQLEVILER